MQKYKSAFFVLTSVSLISLFFPQQIMAVFGNCQESATTQNFYCLEDIFNSVMGIVISGASIGFFVMIVSAGIKWLTSSGDPKDIENAKGRITFAMFGLLIMIASFFVLKFIKQFTGTNVTLFRVPGP